MWILSSHLVQIVTVYSLQQEYAILYDNVLLQDLILRVLVYIVQFAWFLFCFLSVGVHVPLYIGNTSCIICDQLKSKHSRKPECWEA